MTLVRWQFYDPVTTESYTFEINPSEGGSPGFQKNFVFTNTSAADGKTLVYEGQDQAQKIEFSGTILTQAHYDAFVTWWDKRQQIKLTDDLGREFYIVIEEFVPTRQRAVQFPWKHSFKVTSTVVDWP